MNNFVWLKSGTKCEVLGHYGDKYWLVAVDNSWGPGTIKDTEVLHSNPNQLPTIPYLYETQINTSLLNSLLKQITTTDKEWNKSTSNMDYLLFQEYSVEFVKYLLKNNEIYKNILNEILELLEKRHNTAALIRLRRALKTFEDI